MSTQSSGSGSDTSLDSPESLITNMAGSKRKSVIDTRRAEQNRAAQRAFRQRKEVYLKELEAKVRDMEILKDRVNRLEMENERLKYRVWELESSPTSTSTSTSAPTSSSSNSSSTSYHAGANDTTSSSGDSQQRQQQQHWQLSPTDTTPKAIQTTKPTLPSLPSSSPSLSPPTPQHAAGSTSSMPLHILPPPSPSPSVFRPIPVAYWEKEPSSHKRHRSTTNDNQQQQQHEQHPSQHHLIKEETTPSEHGQVLDDLASILRTRHRPPIRQQHQPIKPEPMHS